MLLRINGTSQWENGNNLFCCKVSVLRGPLCQVGGVGQDMKQTYRISGILYFKSIGIDAMNKITKLRII